MRPVSYPRWHFAARVPAAGRGFAAVDRFEECALLAQNESTRTRHLEVGGTFGVGFEALTVGLVRCKAVERIRPHATSFVPSCGRKYPTSSPPQRGMTRVQHSAYSRNASRCAGSIW